MAGNSLFGGQMSGAAPGAKVAVVRVCLFIAGCTAHALIEGMIYVVETDHVDVVNMTHRRPAGAQRRQQRAAVLYNRLIERQRRPDVHLGRQRRPGREHDRRPGASRRR